MPIVTAKVGYRDKNQLSSWKLIGKEEKINEKKMLIVGNTASIFLTPTYSILCFNSVNAATVVNTSGLTLLDIAKFTPSAPEKSYVGQEATIKIGVDIPSPLLDKLNYYQSKRKFDNVIKIVTM